MYLTCYQTYILWSIDSCPILVSADQNQMNALLAQVPTHRGHLLLRFLLPSYQLLIDCRLKFMFFTSQSSKVNGPLLKLTLDLWISLHWLQVHCLKYFINAETGASLLALPKSTRLVYITSDYLIFLNNDCQCIMASFSNLFYLFLMLLLQLMNMAQIIGVQLIINCLTCIQNIGKLGKTSELQMRYYEDAL